MPLVDPVTMSSLATKDSQSTPSKSTEDPTRSQPIEINATTTAQTARHAIPAILGALYLYRFDNLVVDPVAEMTRALPVVVVLQLCYAVVCLPAVGSQSIKPTRKPRPGEKKKAGEGAGPNYIMVCLYPGGWSRLESTLSRSLQHAVSNLFC
jgi:phosphatidylinositol glycan class F